MSIMLRRLIVPSILKNSICKTKSGDLIARCASTTYVNISNRSDNQRILSAASNCTCSYEQRRTTYVKGYEPPWTPKITLAEIEERVLKRCKAYDKINAEKLTLDSHFINDLGLDSLDHVEVIMGIEDEFDCEISDQHADRLMTPKDVIQFIADDKDVYE